MAMFDSSNQTRFVYAFKQALTWAGLNEAQHPGLIILDKDGKVSVRIPRSEQSRLQHGCNPLNHMRETMEIAARSSHDEVQATSHHHQYPYTTISDSALCGSGSVSDSATLDFAAIDHHNPSDHHGSDEMSLERIDRLATGPAPRSKLAHVSGSMYTKGLAHSLRIGDEKAVISFLTDRLQRMHQAADKKIAKAWIKGICPGKQAKFPYRNVAPGWWPDTEEVCRFIEPDHLKKHERTRLCVHLLRLRPTPEQLREWNNERTEHNPTHVTKGWTAFLRELVDIQIFEELETEDKERMAYKQNLMMQMYELAAMEEEYSNKSISDATKFDYWETEAKEAKAMSKKRYRRPTVSESDKTPKRARSGPLSDEDTTEFVSTERDMSGHPSLEAQQHYLCSIEHETADLTMCATPCNLVYGAGGQITDNSPLIGRYSHTPLGIDSSIQGQYNSTSHSLVLPATLAGYTPSLGSHHYIQAADPSFDPRLSEISFPGYLQGTTTQVHQTNYISEAQSHIAPVATPQGTIPMPLYHGLPSISPAQYPTMSVKRTEHPPQIVSDLVVGDGYPSAWVC